MPTPNFANRTLYHGDNLPFLRGINSGTIHLIATDPPFKKGRDFHATPDSLAAGARFEDRWSWDRDVHQDWVDAIQDDSPAVWQVIEASRSAAGEDMAAYLCWLGVRLLEMRRVLRDDGSIYLHIDHTAHAWVKALMDAIFGRINFKNEIVWQYGVSGRGAKARAKHFPRNHDSILFYAKDRRKVRHKAIPIEVEHPVDDLPSHIRQGEDGRYFKTAPRGDYTDASIERLAAEGRIYKTRNGNIRVMYFLERRGDKVIEVQILGSVWEIPDMMHAPKGERQGYPTQKPLEIYQRIIRASTEEGDYVLDPFCGCATTPVAAEQLGRSWIGMDIWDKAHDTVIQRLQTEGLVAPSGDTAGRLLTFGQVFYNTAPPVRSDDGETSSPILRTRKKRVQEPPGPKMTRQEMVDTLIEEAGMVCRGCDRDFDDPLYLELDHNTPRSDGGLNHISNRLLLCGPCNRIKSNRLTLSGLRAENQKRGRMAI